MSKKRGCKGKRAKSSFDLGLPSKCLVSAPDMATNANSFNNGKDEEYLSKNAILAETTLKDVKKKVANLESTILNYNSFDMIAALSFKELACNPETYRECDHEGIGAVVEYISLLYLKQPFNEGKFPVDSRALVSVSDIARSIFSIVNYYYVINAQDESIDKPTDVLEELKYFSVNNELFIRNPSYPHLLKKAIIDIFHPLNGWILENLGFAIEEALIINDEIKSFINSKLSAHRIKTMQNEKNLIKQLRKYRSTKKFIDENDFEILNELSKYNWDEAIKKLRIYVGEKSLSSLGSVYAFTA